MGGLSPPPSTKVFFGTVLRSGTIDEHRCTLGSPLGSLELGVVSRHHELLARFQAGAVVVDTRAGQCFDVSVLIYTTHELGEVFLRDDLPHAGRDVLDDQADGGQGQNRTTKRRGFPGREGRDRTRSRTTEQVLKSHFRCQFRSHSFVHGRLQTVTMW